MVAVSRVLGLMAQLARLACIQKMGRVCRTIILHLPASIRLFQMGRVAVSHGRALITTQAHTASQACIQKMGHVCQTIILRLPASIRLFQMAKEDVSRVLILITIQAQLARQACT